MIIEKLCFWNLSQTYIFLLFKSRPWILLEFNFVSQKRNPLNFLWCINVLTFPIELLLFGAKLSQEKLVIAKTDTKHAWCWIVCTTVWIVDNNLSLHVIVEKFHCCMHQKSEDCLQTRVGHWWPYWIKKIRIRVGTAVIR